MGYLNAPWRSEASDAMFRVSLGLGQFRVEHRVRVVVWGGKSWA